MKTYLEMLEKILHRGHVRKDRTGVGTLGLFGHQSVYDLTEGFPLVTTKKVFIKGIIHELLWMLDGETNIEYLKMNGVKIWDDWANENGDLGPVYGEQWRSWENPDGTAIDQIAELVKNLKENPFSRRHIVTAWNPSVLPDEKKPHGENIANGKAVLPPCHLLFQVYMQPLTTKYIMNEYLNSRAATVCNFAQDKNIQTIHQDYKNGRITLSQAEVLLREFGFPQYGISLRLDQRSCDAPLGAVFNIAFYSLLTMMLGQVVRAIPLEFIHQIGDLHIYLNQMAGVETQLTRDPKLSPLMKIKPGKKSLDLFQYDDFELVGYEHHDPIKFDVAV